MPELFIEIGSEEIPAGYIGPALGYLQKELTGFLKKNRIEAGAAQTFGSPRRLAVCVADVVARQDDVTEVMHGPNVKAASHPACPPPIMITSYLFIIDKT